MARGAMDDAAPLLQAALTLDPQFAMAHRQRPASLGKPGNWRKGRASRKRRSSCARMSACASAISSRLYYNVHERYDDAVEPAPSGAYPDDFDAHELATAWSNVGEIERAIQATREVLRIQPQSSGPANCSCCCSP